MTSPRNIWCLVFPQGGAVLLFVKYTYQHKKMRCLKPYPKIGKTVIAGIKLSNFTVLASYMIYSQW